MTLTAMLDPQPYYVAETQERYSVAELLADMDPDSANGGILWDLAIFKPRPEYEQNEQRYKH